MNGVTSDPPQTSPATRYILPSDLSQCYKEQKKHPAEPSQVLPEFLTVMGKNGGCFQLLNFRIVGYATVDNCSGSPSPDGLGSNHNPTNVS